MPWETLLGGRVLAKLATVVALFDPESQAHRRNRAMTSTVDTSRSDVEVSGKSKTSTPQGPSQMDWHDLRIVFGAAWSSKQRGSPGLQDSMTPGGRSSSSNMLLVAAGGR